MSTSEILTSPSGKYTLRIDKNTEIIIQPGNYEVNTTAVKSTPKFFQQNNVEWVYFNTSYYSQQFINLETGASYNNEGPEMSHNFCWADTVISSDGMIIAVNGCYWACNYEIKFFDLSHLESGISEIPIKDEDSNFYMSVGYAAEEYNWLNPKIFEFKMQEYWSSKYGKLITDLTTEELATDDDTDETKLLFRIQLCRENNHMVYILKESTPEYELILAENKIYREKQNSFQKNFPSNTRYQQLKQNYPEAHIFFFHHNGAHEDLESDIQDVHFGAWLKGIDRLEIKSFKDKTIVGGIEFPTMDDALSFIIREDI